MCPESVLVPYNVLPHVYSLSKSDGRRKLLVEVLDLWEATPLQKWLQRIHKSIIIGDDVLCHGNGNQVKYFKNYKLKIYQSLPLMSTCKSAIAEPCRQVHIKMLLLACAIIIGLIPRLVWE